MSKNSVYICTSLLAIFFLTLHLTDDVIRKSSGGDEGGIGGLFMLLIMVGWVYGIVWLPERKAGYIISLLASLLTSIIPIAHMFGIGGDALPGEILTASGPFFVWAYFGLSVTVISSLIFSAYLLFMPTTEKAAAPSMSSVGIDPAAP